jgi:hypothetical protein
VRIPASYFLARPKLISLLLLASIFLGTCRSSHSAANDRFPAAVIGVHHFGPDYWVDRFYIEEYINDNIGEGGGGGSIACCVTLPRQWRPSLSVDVRWKVHHIVRSTNPKVEDTAELEGIYHAQVPVEEYARPGDLFVHFFPNGRVRILVSSAASNSDLHPIRQGDVKAIRKAIEGKPVKALFTDQELARRLKMFEDDRKKYGDWR